MQPVDCIVDGQEVALKILKAILRSGRIAHAYLLKGPAGSGKTTLAREFAKGLLCLDAGAAAAKSGFEPVEGKALGCGRCESCARVNSGSHPDLMTVEKEGTSIRISASHGMIKEVLTRPIVSRRKVFIVDDAETMTAEAANALLKLLEEPPPYVVFILTTSNEAAIPATVISRCQVIPLRTLPAWAIAAYLERVHNVPEPLSREIAAMSDGSVRKALWLLSQTGEDHVDGKDLISKIAETSPVELALECSRADQEQRHRILAALELEFSRKLSQAAMGYNCGERSEIGEPGVLCDYDFLKRNYRVLKAIMRARRQLTANTNPFLVFCTLFMDIQRFMRGNI